jgi:glutamyl-tRNA reductase
LFDVDDLEMRVEQNREERRREAVKAERLVDEEVGQILQWMKSLEVTPTIVALRHRAEEIKQAEIGKAFTRLQNLSAQERSVVEGLASAIVNKLLHGSLVTLKAESTSGGGAMFIEAARRFFGLDDQGIVGSPGAASSEAMSDEQDSAVVPEPERRSSGKRQA